jgi:hypothetical protein
MLTFRTDPAWMFRTDPIWMFQRAVPDHLIGDERMMNAFRAAVEREWLATVTRETGVTEPAPPRVTLVQPTPEALTLLDEDGAPILDAAGKPVTVRQPWLMVCEGRVT